jgi:uncharacterized membrane protein
MKRKVINAITFLIIFGVVILAAFLITSKGEETSNEIAKCIGENSVLYTQLGCHACETQKNLFGESYQYLNLVDCFYEGEKCSNIEYTPTWIINNEKYVGIQSIEELKELTGC